MFKDICSPFLIYNKKKYIVLLGISAIIGYFNYSNPVWGQATPPKTLSDVILPFEPSGTNISPQKAETEYTLGPGDRLRVDIFQVPEYSGEYIVLVDGTISLPLLGRIPVKDTTLEQISQIINTGYANYIRNPIVTVSLLNPRPLNIGVSGEVNSPGVYSITVEAGQKFPTVTTLIQLANGLTTSAAIRNIQVRRIFKGQQQIIDVNLWSLLQQGDLSQDISLRDQDTIIIPTKQEVDLSEVRQLLDANFGIQANRILNVTIIGEVQRPGSYEIAPQATARTNNVSENLASLEPPRITQAIQVAGGIKPLANIRNIEVRRTTRVGTEQIIPVDLWRLLLEGDGNQDIILQPGDTIFVPTAADISPEEAETLATASFSPSTIRVNVVGQVRSPGTVEVPPNTPLNQALFAAGGFDERRAKKNILELVRINPNGTVTSRKINVDLEADINPETNPILKNNDVIVVNRSTLAAVTDTVGTIIAPIGQIFTTIRFFEIFQ